MEQDIKAWLAPLAVSEPRSNLAARIMDEAKRTTRAPLAPVRYGRTLRAWLLLPPVRMTVVAATVLLFAGLGLLHQNPTFPANADMLIDVDFSEELWFENLPLPGEA